MKPLEQQILELEISRAEQDLKGLLGIEDHPRNELLESKYLKQTPVNHGPEFLSVYALLWDRELLTELGNVPNLDSARELAHQHGFKGIAVEFV